MLVVFEKQISSEVAYSALSKHEAVPQEALNSKKVVVVDIPVDQTVAQAIEELSKDPAIQSVQPNYIYRLMQNIPDAENMESNEKNIVPYARETTNDPMANDASQWYLGKIGAYDAWGISKTNDTIKVAVIDTGIDVTHAEFAGRIDCAYDEVRNTPITGNGDIDSGGHGTNVAGIIAASANNGIGMAGVSYNAKLIAINVFEEYRDGYGNLRIGASTKNVCDAYDYAMAKGARVVNLSLGGYSKQPMDLVLETKITEASNRGVVTVCSGGNGDQYNNPITKPSYPSDFDACISVVPIDKNGVTTSWADYNRFKDIAAPGVGILGLNPNNRYKEMTGSSQASPIVAGVVSLILARNPALSVNEVKNILYSTSIDAGSRGYDEHYGNGIIDAKAALEAVKGSDVIYVNNIKISAENNQTQMTLDQVLQMNAACSPENAYNKLVQWEITNVTGKAAISQDGMVTPISQGIVKIKARAKDGGNAYAEYLLKIVNDDAVFPKACGVNTTPYNLAGTQFHAGVLQVSDRSGVAKVEFAVWSDASGGADLKWYQGNNYHDGNWGAVVDIANHGSKSGNYQVHVYATDGMGNRGLVGNAVYTADVT
ncbi:MAG: S8 family serine peptidase [Acinetobacter sp.]